MTGNRDLAVSWEDAADTYRRFAADAAVAEDGSQGLLPVSETADVASALRGASAALAARNRTARTVPVVNVYDRLVDRDVADSLVSALVALDVVVNAADDVVDTNPLGDRERVEHCSNLLFGHLQLAANLSDPAAAVSVLTDYYAAIAQIPHVERTLQRRLIRAPDADEEVEIARAVYAYDSVDIEGFALLPAVEFDVGAGTAADLLDDFRTFRARHLLYEDLRHPERTVSQNDTNPVMYFLESRDSPGAVAARLEEVLSTFEYGGSGDYVDLLRSFERGPDDLEAVAADGMESL